MTKKLAYWLMKTEPDTYSLDDLERQGKTLWEGVRNYQARNHLVAMKVGDRALVYHSNAEPSGVVGVGVVTRIAAPDPTAFDPNSPYYDERSRPDEPRWFAPELSFLSRLPRLVSLAELKADPALEGLETTRRGSRLSVHPVSKAHFDRVLWLAARPPEGG